jgi:hypothetical protein
MVCLGKEEIRLTQGSGSERAAEFSETLLRRNDVLRFRRYAVLSSLPLPPLPPLAVEAEEQRGAMR